MRALIVDDEAPARAKIRRMLAAAVDVEIVGEASTGREAVRLARALRPNLVLMDIGLPGLDGWQASRVLKSDPVTRGIPLVAFSARVDSSADLGERASFDGFIRKPVSPSDLARRVGAYLELVEPSARVAE